MPTTELSNYPSTWMVFLHLICVLSSITLVLGYMFNKILVEGLLNTKTMHTIVSNHKFKGTCQLQNYQIILINHMLMKLSGVVLRKKLNSHYEVEEMQLQAKRDLREPSLIPIVFSKPRCKFNCYMDVL